MKELISRTVDFQIPEHLVSIKKEDIKKPLFPHYGLLYKKLVWPHRIYLRSIGVLNCYEKHSIFKILYLRLKHLFVKPIERKTFKPRTSMEKLGFR